MQQANLDRIGKLLQSPNIGSDAVVLTVPDLDLLVASVQDTQNAGKLNVVAVVGKRSVESTSSVEE